jgi:ribosome-associated protein
MIRINHNLSVPDSELEWQFIRASGPGGQKVNKASTAVQLRFNALHSASLPDEVRVRLLRLAGRRLSSKGVIVIDARRFRSQERNRQDALERLARLLRRATTPPKPRKPTRPSVAAKRRRLEDKRRRGDLKRIRRGVAGHTDA